MTRVGADLGPAFTARELRSAYRMLARRYHPDRHPASNQAERSRLARVFADLNDDHRSLLTALDKPSAAGQL